MGRGGLLTPARRWAEVWAGGWRKHDVDAIVELYAEDARFRSAPFRDEHVGRAGVREYVAWAFAEEDSAECWFGEPIEVGDRAVVEYWAVMTSGGEDETLSGVSMLRFNAAGLVAEQHDYWSMEPGRRELPPGWGG